MDAVPCQVLLCCTVGALQVPATVERAGGWQLAARASHTTGGRHAPLHCQYML